MESILDQLGLGTPLEQFSSEKVDPDVVLSMSESFLILLGVETLGDRIRIKERCKQYVEGDNRGTTFTSSSPVQQIAEGRRMLFQPYSSHRGQGIRAAKADKRKNHPDVRGRATLASGAWPDRGRPGPKPGLKAEVSLATSQALAGLAKG